MTAVRTLATITSRDAHQLSDYANVDMVAGFGRDLFGDAGMRGLIFTGLMLALSACGQSAPPSGDAEAPGSGDTALGEGVTASDPIEELFAQAREAAADAPPVALNVSRAMLAVFSDANSSSGARIFTQVQDGEQAVLIMRPLLVIGNDETPVLITGSQMPGSMRWMSVSLSAFYLRRARDGALTVDRRFDDFATVGENGHVGEVYAVNFMGAPALANTWVGGNQGCYVTLLNLYALGQDGPRTLFDHEFFGYSFEHERGRIEIQGSIIEPTPPGADLAIRFTGEGGGILSDDTVLYSMVNGALEATSGVNPIDGC